jgi:hypothetical protein
MKIQECLLCGGFLRGRPALVEIFDPFSGFQSIRALEMKELNEIIQKEFDFEVYLQKKENVKKSH